MKEAKERLSPLGHTPEEIAHEAQGFAREHLGPMSESLLANPVVQTRILSGMRYEMELEDAVLAEVHRASVDDPLLADEFVAYFLSDLMRLAHSQISPGLQRYLDSGDLVGSVLGKLWKDLCNTKFESRATFLAYLARGLHWKAAGQVRKLTGARRREDRRDPCSPEELELVGPDCKPDSLAGAREERERLILILPRLPEFDRKILTLHLQGHSREKIAEQLGMGADAMRKALSRATQRARGLL